jgi:endonuclease YncB( thermonuclease family)
LKQTASVEATGKDRYGRLVAIVTCNDTNANEAMLNLGMAWVYQRFKKRYPHYDALEQDARYYETGLWMDEDPIPPWVWRNHKRGR